MDKTAASARIVPIGWRRTRDHGTGINQLVLTAEDMGVANTARSPRFAASVI